MKFKRYKNRIRYGKESWKYHQFDGKVSSVHPFRNNMGTTSFIVFASDKAYRLELTEQNTPPFTVREL